MQFSKQMFGRKCQKPENNVVIIGENKEVKIFSTPNKFK